MPGKAKTKKRRNRRSLGIKSSASSTGERGFYVQVLLPGGDPEGLKIVEKSNWNGVGIVFPRAMFGENRSRAELARAGVYLLVGPGDTAILPTVYVGHGEPVRHRLEQHATKKDFWTHAVIFTSKDVNLNKAHVQRLESHLVERALATKRCVLTNDKVPQYRPLSDAEVAMVDSFLDDLLLCLPILGYSAFEESMRLPMRGPTLELKGKGIAASGREASAGFVVLRGARAVGNKMVAPMQSPCVLAAEGAEVIPRTDEVVSQ